MYVKFKSIDQKVTHINVAYCFVLPEDQSGMTNTNLLSIFTKRK